MAEAQFRLDMILDATKFETGSKKASDAAIRLSAVSKSLGLSVEGLTNKLIREAEAAQIAGTLTEESGKKLTRVKEKLKELNVEQGKSAGAGATGLAKSFDEADKRAQKVLQRSKDIGITLDRFRAIKIASPFQQLLTDSATIREETNRLRGIFANLFGEGSASAARMTDVVRTLGRVFTGTASTTKEMKLALLDTQRAMKNLNKDAPSKKLTDGIRVANDIMRTLKGNTALTREQFRTLRETLGPIAQQILGVNVASKEFASTLSNVKGRDAFRKQLEDVIRLGTEMENLVAKRQAAFGKDVKLNSFQRDIATNLKGASDTEKLDYTKRLAGLNKYISGNQKLREAVGKTAGSLADLTRRQKVLDAFMKRFGPLVNSTTTPIGNLRRTILELSDAMGIAFIRGEKVGDFIRRVQDRASGARRELDSLEASARRFGKGIRAAATGMSKFNELTSIAIQKIIRYRVAFFLMSRAIQGLRDAISTFKDVQAELANIEKVIDPVAGQMERLKDEAFSFAQKFGEEIGNVLNVMKIFAQQGKQFNEILSLTETTLIAAAGAGLSTQQAVEALTAASRAYNITAESTIGIVDKLANVQANFAITAQDLAEAIKLIASAGKEVGVGLDELVGHVTAIGQVTRKSGRNIAQSLKTIFARFERSSTINQFKQLQIEIQGTDGSIRPLNQVLIELNEKWVTLTDSQRFAIAQTVAGVRRYTDFLVLMDQFDQSLLATKTSLEAQGQAQRNASIELATFGRQIQSVQASLQETFSGIAEAGLAPAVASLLALSRGISDIINRSQGLTTFVGILTTLSIATFAVKAASIGATLGFRQIANVAGIASGANVLVASTISKIAVAQVQKNAQDLIEVAGSRRRLLLQQALLTGNKAEIAAAVKSLIAKKAKNIALTEEQKKTLEAALTTAALSATEEAAVVSTNKLTVAMRGLGATLKTLFGPVGLISIGVTALALYFGKMALANAANVRFQKSQADTARNLQKRIEVENHLTASITNQLEVLEELREGYENEESSVGDLVLRRAALIEQSNKLIGLYGGLAGAVDESTGSILDYDKAIEALAKRQDGLDDLSKQFDDISLASIRAAREVREAVREAQAVIAGFDPETVGASFRTGQFTSILDNFSLDELIEQSGEQAKAQVRRDFADVAHIIGDAGAEIPKALAERVAEGNTELNRVTTNIARTNAKAFTKSYTQALKDNFSSFEPLLQARKAQFGSVGKELDQLLAAGNFDAFEKDLNKRFDLARNPKEIQDGFKSLINPIQAIALELQSADQSAAEVIAQFANFKLSKQILEQTGFVMADLTKIMSNTAIRADKAVNSYRAFVNVVDGVAITGGNIVDIYDEVGVAFNTVAAKAAKARETVDVFASVIERLEGAAVQPGELIPAQYIAQITDLGTRFQFEGEEIEAMFRSLRLGASGDFDEMRKSLASSTDQAAKDVTAFLDVVTSRPEGAVGGDELIRAFINLAKAGDTLKLTTEQLETLRKTLNDLLLASFNKEKLNFKGDIEDLRELQTSLRKVNDAIRQQEQLSARAFGALGNIGRALNIGDAGTLMLINAQVHVLADSVEERAKARMMTILGAKDEEDYIRKLKGHHDELKHIVEEEKDAVKAQSAMLILQFHINSAMKEAKTRSSAVTDELKNQRAAMNSVLKASIEIFKARGDELGVLKATQDVQINNAKIAGLKRERDIVDDISDRLEKSGKLRQVDLEHLDAILDKSTIHKDRIDEIKSLYRGVSVGIEVVVKELAKLDSQLEDLDVRKILLAANKAVAQNNLEFSKQESLINRVFEIDKKIVAERQKALGISSASQQKTAAKIQVDSLNRQIAATKTLIAENDAILVAHFDQIVALEDNKDLALEIQRILGIQTDEYLEQAVALRANNAALEALQTKLREAQGNLSFATAIASIDAFNVGQDAAIQKQKLLIDIVSEFDNKSILFKNQAAKENLGLIEREIAAQVSKQKNALKELDALEAQVAAQDVLAGSADDQLKTKQALEEMNKKIAESEKDSASALNNLAELGVKLAEARVVADPVFQKMLKDSELFNARIGNAAGSIAEFFGSLPEQIVSRFDKIKDIEKELAELQGEILQAEAASKFADDFDEAQRAISALRTEEGKLREDLREAKSLTQALKEEFTRLAGAIGQSVLDVQVDIFKEQLESLFADMFGGEEAKRRQAIISATLEAYRLAGEQLKLAFAAGGTIAGGIIKQDIIAAHGGRLGAGSATISGPTIPGTGVPTQGLRITTPRPGDLPDDDNPLKDPAEDLETAGEKLQKAGSALLQLAAVSAGTAAGGGGLFASFGAAAGSLLGLASGPLGIGGSILGGLVGGLLDRDEDIDLPDALEENTDAVESNTQELRDLRHELINAPARFTVPAFASVGGAIPAGAESLGGSDSSSVVVSEGGGINITQSFSGTVNPDAVKRATLDAVRQGYQEEKRRFGRRVTR